MAKKVVHIVNFGRYKVVFLTKCYGLRNSNNFKKVSQIFVERSLADWLGCTSSRWG